MTSLGETARFVQSLAASSGAKECAVESTERRELNIQWRNGKLESISDASVRNLRLGLFIDNKYSSFVTTDLRPNSLKDFVKNAANLTRVLTKDPYRALPSPEFYKNRAALNLEVYDLKASQISIEELTRKVERIESAAKSGPQGGSVVTMTAYGGMSMARTYLLQSNGFEGEHQSSSFDLSADVSVKDPSGKRPSGEEYVSACHWEDLPDPESIGRQATARALQSVGAKKTASGKFTVVVDNRAASRLWSRLADALRGSALQQKRSFLDGKVGQPIASDVLSVGDEPLLRRGLGSRFFDSEGMTAKPFPLIENGILRNYYIDSYYSRKLRTRPTTADMSNLNWKLGQKSQEQLINDVGSGFLIRDFLGGNSNSTSGDFSLGVSGQLIKNGRVGKPFAEMNLSGNHLDFWKRLVAIGNDPFPYNSRRTPTLVFEQAQMAGA
ncbi:MAG: TldD/PmbA family protein [Bdellovibrionales bacterium]